LNQLLQLLGKLQVSDAAEEFKQNFVLKELVLLN
jgi:hypothetical protein